MKAGSEPGLESYGKAFDEKEASGRLLSILEKEF